VLKTRSYILLALAMCSWGAANPLADIALREMSVSHMLLTEIGAGLVALSLIALVRGLNFKISWKWALLLGVLQPGLTFLFGNIGYVTGTVVTGLIIMASEVLLLALFGVLFLRERINGYETLAIIIGFSGALLVGWSATNEGLGTVTSALAFLLAATCAAGYSIAIRYYAIKFPDTDMFHLTWAQTFVTFLLILVSMPITSGLFESAEFSTYSSTTLLAALGSGLFGVAIPFVLYAEASKVVPARHAAIGLNIIPVVGISIGAALGLGLPTGLQYVGGFLVLASLFALSRRNT
jgi:drug/metabolite transporter (DMT)-like permease